jgi:magnesium chelatase family protein
MVARVRTVAFEGVDVRPVDAQVQVSGGMPAFTLVGPIAHRNWQAYVLSIFAIAAQERS